MKVIITYRTNKTKEVRTKAFFRDSVKEALRYFEWRYGHEIISVNSIQPASNPPCQEVFETIPVMEPMVAGENCGAFMADGSRMV